VGLTLRRNQEILLLAILTEEIKLVTSIGKVLVNVGTLNC